MEVGGLKRFARGTRLCSIGLVAMLAGAASAATAPQIEMLRLVAEATPSADGSGTLEVTLDAEAFDRLWTVGRLRIVDFPLPERPSVELELDPFQLATPSARFVAVDHGVEREVPRPRMRHFRGHVVDDPTGLVILEA